MNNKVMKGKSVFTKQEIAELRLLIRQLERCNDANRKKRIRAKMRDLKFYCRDDWNITGMNESHFDALINAGKIKVI